MKYITLTKGKTALVDDEDFEWLSQWKWCVNEQGYAIRGDGPKKKRISIFMHKQIMGFPENKVDHINMIRSDNRRSNLRHCTHKQNLMNSGLRNNNTSGYKGVHLEKKTGKWVAQTRGDNSRSLYLGTYNTPEQAAIAYNREVFKRHGEFAYLNKVNQ